MLDGLLRRGFAAKCKSLIKLIKNRIDVIRRKRKATEKFFKQDIADLLANGLDINAYGRADGLVVERTMSSCYDFIEQSCDFVMKRLPVMQSLSGCPEECREAVSSLMLAAARFSDLPELRGLRQIFQERYGNSLDCYVNQEFAANLNVRPSTLEKKVNLMQEIASEFSINWDFKAFEEKMSKPSAFAQDHKIYKTNHLTHNNKSSHGNDGALKGDKHVLLEQRPAHPINKAIVSKRVYDDAQSRSRPPKYRLNQHNGCDDILKSDIHDHEKRELNAKRDRRHRNEDSMPKPIVKGGLSQDQGVEQFEDGCNWGSRTLHREETLREETPMANPYYNTHIPPPYVKSSSKQKTSKSGANVDFSQEDQGNISAYPSPHGEPDVASASERIHLSSEKGLATEVPAPKSKSSRRKHSKSRPSHYDANSSQYDASAEHSRIVTRKLRSRRRDDPRRGLQLLFDDDRYRSHEEERIMDKLLLYYSKKPSILPEKWIRKNRSRHARQMDNSAREFSRNDESPEMNAALPRSVSLPREETEVMKGNKEFTRGASFQPDRPTVARHVHPKLPDYDDLAARFAALKGR
ncbi:uncharacterized protein LOC129292068 [Prosopis cineraria]|uniref:uncharacterized protein LOC129292068 n=1 Tax=Prosopis cineraria TaxID=364024 RepID=UPI00240F80EC|nr:uncharacterized protein LOC129292068 [Prosopis cineraria]